MGVPYIVTHDGRTIRFPHPDIKKNDTVKVNLETHEIEGVVKFDNGASVYVVGGNKFATRLGNVFVIGDGKKPWISLPKLKGIRLTLVEERDQRDRRHAADDEDEE